MSPQLLARLQRIARQTRRMVTADNAWRAERFPSHRRTTVRDFHRPDALVRLYGDWA